LTVAVLLTTPLVLNQVDADSNREDNEII